MTQFIPLTVAKSNAHMRVNIDGIVQYVRDPAGSFTDVLFSTGGVVMVNEDTAVIDDLIRNKNKTAILSGES